MRIAYLLNLDTYPTTGRSGRIEPIDALRLLRAGTVGGQQVGDGVSGRSDLFCEVDLFTQPSATGTGLELLLAFHCRRTVGARLGIGE